MGSETLGLVTATTAAAVSIRTLHPAIRLTGNGWARLFCWRDGNALRAIIAALLTLILTWSGAAPAQARNPAPKTPQLIVKFRSGVDRSKLAPTERVALLSTETGVPLVHLRSMAFGFELVSTFRSLSKDKTEATAAMLSRHPDVEAAAPDYLRGPSERW